MLKRIQTEWLERQVRARGGQARRGHIAAEDITPDLLKAGVTVEPYSVPVDDLDAYVASAGYAALPYYESGQAWGAREKYLEHFVSLDLMKPRPREVLIDIACMESPFSEIAAELYGLETYRQDLIFATGIHGREIGGNAAALPVPDQFADHLTLHCSFEHFEGDSDSRFIREAARVLKPGGKLCILPLYTAASYAIQTHARGWRRFRAPFEPGDTVYVARFWGPPFARFYDATSFVRRVVEHLGDLRLRIFRLTNVDEAGKGCYLRYIALLEKPS